MTSVVVQHDDAAMGFLDWTEIFGRPLRALLVRFLEARRLVAFLTIRLTAFRRLTIGFVASVWLTTKRASGLWKPVTRARAPRIVAVCAGSLIGVFAVTDVAQAATCAGTMGLTINGRGREVPMFSFRCDVQIGGSYAGRLFEVTFGEPNITTINEVRADQEYLDSAALQGQCEQMEPPAVAEAPKSYVLCSSNDGARIGAGTTITGTPWSAEDMPVCSRSGVVTVYGSDGATVTTFPLASTCPANWTVRNRLTIEVFGSGTVTANGISCRGSCTYRYPQGTTMSFRVVPAKGATFVGWGDSCRGTTSRCTVALDDDAIVSATFRPGSSAAGPLRVSVARAPRLSGTTVSTMLRCYGRTRAHCTVRAVLTTKSRQPATLATRTVTIPAGAERTVSLSLNATGKSLLRRSRTLPAQMTASLTNTIRPTIAFLKTITFRQ